MTPIDQLCASPLAKDCQILSVRFVGLTCALFRGKRKGKTVRFRAIFDPASGLLSEIAEIGSAERKRTGAAHREKPAARRKRKRAALAAQEPRPAPIAPEAAPSGPSPARAAWRDAMALRKVREIEEAYAQREASES